MPRRAAQGVTVGVRLPEALKDRLYAEADRRDVSVSKLTEIILARCLPDWENDPRLDRT